MKARRILITGGAGFIGTHLAERFCGAAEIVLLDNFRRDSLAWVPHLKTQASVRIVEADVLNADSLRPALEGVDTVIHAAAIAGVSSYYKESLRTLRVNILGTANVLEAAVEAKVKTFVQFSTSEIFGTEALWVDETAPARIGAVTDRRWVYATSKLAGEHLALRTGETHGIACTVLRPFNIYGPRQVGEGAISNFCRNAVRGEAMVINGDGSPIRSWCYIDDFVNAVEAVLKSSDVAGKAFNIGNPTQIETTSGLARRVKAIAPATPIVYQPAPPAEIRVRIPSIELAQQVLNFSPRVDLDEGLRRTHAWFLATHAREKEAVS